MNELDSSAASNPPSATRFNMKSLLALTAVVAMGASLVGWQFRNTGEKAQQYLGIMWASTFAVCLLLIVVQHWRRWRAEQAVGIVRFRASTSRANIVIIACLLLMVLFVLGMRIGPIERGYTEPSAGSAIRSGIFPGVLVSLLFTHCWWPKEVWVGEKGIVYLVSFRPWQTVVSWHRKPEYALLRMTLNNFWLSEKEIQLRISNEQLYALFEFLREKLGPSGRSRIWRPTIENEQSSKEPLD